MKEMAERVAELEQRMGRLEALVPDPDAAANDSKTWSAAKVYDDEDPLRVTSGGTSWPDAKPPADWPAVDPPLPTKAYPLDSVWDKPVSFSGS
jgi:hypothetical protein